LVAAEVFLELLVLLTGFEGGGTVVVVLSELVSLFFAFFVAEEGFVSFAGRYFFNTVNQRSRRKK
jgi:hypothetical protein